MGIELQGSVLIKLFYRSWGAGAGVTPNNFCLGVKLTSLNLAVFRPKCMIIPFPRKIA